MMSLVQGFLLTALAALVVLHMASPRFRRLRLSAAKFFHDLPPADDTRRRFTLGNPLRSRPFYPQLLVLALTATALLAARGCERQVDEQLGLWIFVDTSLSMTTVQDGETRLDAARREVRRFLDQAARIGTHPPCLRLSMIDMEIAPPWPAPVDRTAFESLLDGVEARALGTDLGRLRELTDPPSPDTDETCPVQVRLVVSDLPAPDWAGEPGSGWIWRDVARPAANVGLTSIEPVRDPFGGRMDAVAVEVTAYGPPPGRTQLEVLDDAGRAVDTADVEWPPDGPWRYQLPAPKAGSYRLKISPGGAYAGDDEATIEVPEGSELRVDWRLRSTEWLDRFGWSRTAQDPDLVVTAPGVDLPEGPVLIAGERYGRGREGEIAFFEPDSELLDGLNFDVAEEARILGVELPEGFEPVLAGSLDGDVWVARRDEPRGVYLPGLPTGGDDPLGRFSATLFVQSLRWLLSQTPPPPLFTLTDPAQPEPEGSRIALHEGEGKTDHRPLSRGDVDELEPAVRRPVETPTWPWWLAGVAGVFLLEQLLLVYGGDAWR